MNIARTVTTVELNVPTVDSVTEAEQVMQHVLGGKVTNKAQRHAANGLVEAFFVGYLNNVPKTRGALLNAIRDLQPKFGDYNPFKRALSRVKAVRRKNDAWNTIKA